MSTTTKLDETRVAEMIVSVLPEGLVARVCCDDRDTIKYAVRAVGMKLTSIVFRRDSLRRLLSDTARAIKLEYLQRDLLSSLTRRAEYRYPRPSLTPKLRRAVAFALPA